MLVCRERTPWRSEFPGVFLSWDHETLLSYNHRLPFRKPIGPAISPLSLTMEKGSESPPNHYDCFSSCRSAGWPIYWLASNVGWTLVHLPMPSGRQSTLRSTLRCLLMRARS